MDKERILVVDDEVAFTRLLKLALEHRGCYTVEVENCACRAVQVAIQFQPDLVLMDVMMPVMDGLAATREIRAREAREGLARLPIIALTANTLRPDVDAAIAAGMDGHVAKPFTQHQLAQALSRHLRVAI